MEHRGWVTYATQERRIQRTYVIFIKEGHSYLRKQKIARGDGGINDCFSPYRSGLELSFVREISALFGFPWWE